MSLTIWHNPRCSKSRQALDLLEDKYKDIEIYKYLDNVPNVEEIEKILKLLGMGARELMRTKEDLYKELGLKEEHDEAKLIAAMAAHPKLIERPIVIKDGKAVIGRPPEKVLELL